MKRRVERAANGFGIAKRIAKKWWKEGDATWAYRGAPGRDGKWGGTFHSVDPMMEKGELHIHADLGSADIVSAVNYLREELKKAGYKTRVVGPNLGWSCHVEIAVKRK
jgi:hypothetical protein